MSNILTKKQFTWEMLGSPYLLFLIVLYVTFNLLGTTLIYKLVVVGPGLAPGGLFVLPFVLLIEDVIAEVYGYAISRLIFPRLFFRGLLTVRLWKTLFLLRESCFFLRFFWDCQIFLRA